MTASDYRKSIKELIEDMPRIAAELCIKQALSGLTIVKNRSINDGIFLNSSNGAFVEYSNRLTSTDKFKGKELNSGGRSYINSNARGTWHDFRKAQGRTSEKVNLSYSSRMWSSIAIVRTAKVGSGFMCVISSSDDSITYLSDLVNRYGNFINPTEVEVLALQKDTTSEILQILRNKL